MTAPDRKNLLLVCFLSAFFLFSCNEVKDKIVKSEKQNTAELVETDIAFSTMSRQVGMKKAFMQYMAKEGSLLRPGSLPLVGADAINYLSEINDTSYTVTWKPTYSDIAKSNDLGYTFGTYELSVGDTVMKGTYTRIWKKQEDGTWKFVLDSANQGTGN